MHRWIAQSNIRGLSLGCAVVGALLVSTCNEESPELTEPGLVAEPAVATAAAALPFSQISVGNVHTCAVTTDDRAYCWGENSLGQLGDGTENTFRLTPVAVLGPS